MKFRVIIDGANHEVQLFPETAVEHAMMKLLGDGTWRSHVTIEGGQLYGEVRRVSLTRTQEAVYAPDPRRPDKLVKVGQLNKEGSTRTDDWYRTRLQLPEVPGRYLIYHYYSDTIQICWWDGDKWDHQWTITHWMMLPDKPLRSEAIGDGINSGNLRVIQEPPEHQESTDDPA